MIDWKRIGKIRIDMKVFMIWIIGILSVGGTIWVYVLKDWGGIDI